VFIYLVVYLFIFLKCVTVHEPHFVAQYQGLYVPMEVQVKILDVRMS